MNWVIVFIFVPYQSNISFFLVRMVIIRSILILFFLFLFGVVQSQEISGVVFDSKANIPLEGASVYFDNTTIGTTTNSRGEFILEFNEAIKTPLIISFIGYETIILHSFSTTAALEVHLNESTNVLNEVVLDNKDDWPRKLKLKEFKRNYLGESKNGMSSEILNEDDIILRYDKDEKKLSAQANVPILIRNKRLKYLITIGLKNFEVNYYYVSKNKKRLKVANVFYSGSNFYKSMEDSPTSITIDNRLDAYYGSTLHFMRALANQNLENTGYKLYIGNIPYKSEKYIIVTPVANSNKKMVKLKDRFSIIYKNKKRSSLESLATKFYIDNFGNHSPPEAVRFGGDFGKQRMGDSLPLDFLLTSNFSNKTNE